MNQKENARQKKRFIVFPQGFFSRWKKRAERRGRDLNPEALAGISSPEQCSFKTDALPGYATAAIRAAAASTSRLAATVHSRLVSTCALSTLTSDKSACPYLSTLAYWRRCNLLFF